MKTIKKNAFEGCKNLVIVNLNEGFERVEDECFNGTKIKEVVVPATVNHIGSYAFPKDTIVSQLPANDLESVWTAKTVRE